MLFRQPVGEDIERQFLVLVGLHDRVAHAIERFVERQIGINSGTDNCRVCKWADHAFGSQVSAVGHRGRNANVITSASQQ